MSLEQHVVSADSRQSSPNRRSGKEKLIMLALVLLMALAALVYTYREALRESWLRGQPTEDLRRQDARQDADALLHFVYARRLFDRGEGTAARGPERAAVSSLPKTEESDLAERVWALAGCLAADYGDPQEAEGYLQQAEHLRRDDPLLSLGRGAIAIRQERLADAVEALTRAVQQDSTSIEAWKHLGKAYMLGAETEKAVAALRQATLLAPKDPMIHADLGQELLQLKQFPEAKKEYQTVSVLLPDDPYYSTLTVRVAALAARSEADYSQAADQLQTALSRTPEDDGLRAELAGLYLRFNRLEPARQELETILEHNPVISADCWFNLYTVCKRTEDKHSAEIAHTHFQQIIERKQEVAELTEQTQLHPNDAQNFLRLSNALLELRQMEKAYAALSRAAMLAPNDPVIASTMARAQAFLRATQGAALQNVPGALPK